MKLFQKEFEPSVSNVERDKNGTDRKHWTNRTLDDDLAIKSKELKKENFRLDEDTEEDFKCIYQTDEKEVLQALKYRLKDSSELVNPTKENTFEDELLKSYILGDMSRPKASDSRASALNIGCYNSGRNLLWIPRIKRILETYDKVFVVVGASHVIKETPTLLNLLEKNGFSIKRVTK